jgi:hypothetical protein
MKTREAPIYVVLTGRGVTDPQSRAVKREAEFSFDRFTNNKINSRSVLHIANGIALFMLGAVE